MNARRLAILAPVMLALLVGIAAAQVPEPAAPGLPIEEPMLPEPQPPLPSAQMPGIPGTGFPELPPNLPNLQAPPPATMDGTAIAPLQPRSRRTDNPLLKLFDADGDGIISGNEVEDAPARLWELDRNLDAELSTNELDLILAPRWEQRRRGVPGHLPVEPVQPEPEMPVLSDQVQGSERSRLQVYPLRGLDPARTVALLQQMLVNQPEARLTFDARTRSLLALAPASAHALIRKTLADLLVDDRAGLGSAAMGIEGAAAMPKMALPVVPRVVPVYNARTLEILRAVKQIYRDRITEPRRSAALGDPRLPGEELPPMMDAPVVPAGKMVIGQGEDPDTIVISAEDELFFEVLDLIERLDGRQEPGAEDMPTLPVQ